MKIWGLFPESQPLEINISPTPTILIKTNSLKPNTFLFTPPGPTSKSPHIKSPHIVEVNEIACRYI
jgi:hypothetical protein